MEECYFCEEFETPERPLSPLGHDDWICRECAEKKVKKKEIYQLSPADWTFVAVAKPWVTIEVRRIVTRDFTDFFQLPEKDQERYSFAIVHEPINQKVMDAILQPDEHQFNLKEVAQMAWQEKKALQFFAGKFDKKGKVFFPGNNGLNGPEKIEKFLEELIVPPHRWFVGVIYEKTSGDEFFPPAWQRELFFDPDVALRPWFDRIEEAQKRLVAYEFNH